MTGAKHTQTEDQQEHDASDNPVRFSAAQTEPDEAVVEILQSDQEYLLEPVSHPFHEQLVGNYQDYSQHQEVGYPHYIDKVQDRCHHYNGIVHQHPECDDQREQNDHVDLCTLKVENHEGDQQG